MTQAPDLVMDAGKPIQRPLSGAPRWSKDDSPVPKGARLEPVVTKVLLSQHGHVILGLAIVPVMIKGLIIGHVDGRVRP